MLIDSKNSIRLQTARVNVKKPDSCSQRGYITEELQRTLHLPVAGQKTLLIKTFGEAFAKLQRCDIVQAAVQIIDEINMCSHQFTQENYSLSHKLT